MKKIIIALFALFLVALAAFFGFFSYEEYRQRGSAAGISENAATPGSAGHAPEEEEDVFADFPDIGERVPVFPKLSNLAVLKINVRRGDTVREGQVLAELDDAPLREELLRLGEQVRRAEENYRAAVKSGDPGAESLGALLDEARGSLAGAEARVGYRYVIAPAGGVLVERNVRTGDKSRADSLMFVIGLLAAPAAPGSDDRG